MAYVLDDAGKLHLAVPLGTATRGAALTRILALRGSPGWIVGAPGIREWRYQGVIEREGTVHISNVMKAENFDARAAKRGAAPAGAQA